MKAFLLTSYGKNEKLQLTETPTPAPQADEVLIEAHAAGVNQLDFKLRDGEFKLILPYQLPTGLGHDVAGVVTAVGARVSQFKVGDEVYARPADFRIGTFAEFIAVREADVARKPANLTMVEAGSLPLVALTAWQALVDVARLQKGAEGVHPGRFGRGGHGGHSVGQAPGGLRGHHDQRGQYRAGHKPRR